MRGLCCKSPKPILDFPIMGPWTVPVPRRFEKKNKVRGLGRLLGLEPGNCDPQAAQAGSALQVKCISAVTIHE